MCACVAATACTPLRGGAGLPPIVDGGDGQDPGVVGDAALVLSVAAHDYGTVLVGQRAEAIFLVANRGPDPSGVLSVTLDGSGAPAFEMGDDQCRGQLLRSGASCRIVVAAQPSAPGLVAAALAIAAHPGGNTSATLTANALPVGTLQLAPGAQDFALAPVGHGIAFRYFTIVNTGTTVSGPITITLGGTDAAQFATPADICSRRVLPAGGSCDIAVQFVPSTLGAKSASLAVTASPGGTGVAQLTGAAISPGTLTITPDHFDYGSTTEGRPGVTQTFMVANTGPSATAPLEVALAGATGDFTVSGGTCRGQSLAPLTSCAASVQFTPATPGTKLASVTVADPAGDPIAVAQLTGAAPRSSPLSISPASKDYGPVHIGTESVASFLVSNLGGTPTGVPSLALTGTDAALFSVSSNGCSGSILVGGGCTINLRFSPATVGIKGAILTVTTTPDGTATATLAGTGVNSAPPP